jgi:hypothetical protein
VGLNITGRAACQAGVEVQKRVVGNVEAARQCRAGGVLCRRDGLSEALVEIPATSARGRSQNPAAEGAPRPPPKIPEYGG